MKAPEAKVEKVSGMELNQEVNIPVGTDGKIPFSKDGVHPYLNTGHQLYMDALIRSLPAIMAASKGACAHTLPLPKDSRNYENSITIPLDRTHMSGPWTRIPATQGLARDFASRVDLVWKGEPGATLSFKFKGSSAMVYDLKGPDCGSLEMTVDGTVTKVNRIDGWSTYSRLALLKIAGGLDPEKIHEVLIKVRPDKLDKEKILFEGNRKELLGNPKKYEPLNWYVGAIYIGGSLSE